MDPWICEPHHPPSPDDGGADALLPNEAYREHAHLGRPADLVEESGKKNEDFFILKLLKTKNEENTKYKMLQKNF